MPVVCEPRYTLPSGRVYPPTAAKIPDWMLPGRTIRLSRPWREPQARALAVLRGWLPSA